MPVICWENHSVHFQSLVSSLYKNSEVTDCILDTNGGLLQGHKTILAAFSPYLKKLFMDHHNMKIFSFKEVKYKDMKLILDFLYYGSINGRVTEVASLMETADLLQIKSLLCSQNFAEKYHIRETIEKSVDDSVSKNGVNLVTSEGDVSAQENRTNNFKSQGALKTKVTICSKKPSGKVNEGELEGKVSNSNEFKMDVISKEESFLDELPPNTFVSVNPASIKSEDPNDELLTVTLEEYQYNRDMSTLTKRKEKSGFRCASQLKMEVKEGVSCDTTSCVYSKDDSTKLREDLEMEFESICDIAECDLKDETPFNVSWNHENFEDCKREPCSWKEKRENLKCKATESSLLDYRQDMKEGLCLANVNTLELKERNDNLTIDGTPKLRMKPTKNEEECVLQNTLISPMHTQTFSKKSKLKLHVQDHTQKNQHICNICEKSFFCKSYLNVHMRIHTGVKRFACDICKKSFYVKSKLSVHMRIHTGEKLFPCDICEKSFYVKSQLKEHRRTHTGEKPFVCSYCQKSFCAKSSLSRHTQIHTREKPFPRKNVLETHMNRHTGKKSKNKR